MNDKTPTTLEADYVEAIASGRLRFVVVEPDPVTLIEALRNVRALPLINDKTN